MNQIKRMEWENVYLEGLIDALRPFGTVLEVGFNLGVAATRIQTFKPKSHTIIEADPRRADQALLWAKDYKNIQVLSGSWEKYLPELGRFDSIFFDDYSLGLDTRVLHATSHSEKELLNCVEMAIPNLRSMQYSDADLDLFYQEKGKDHPEETARFLSELCERGQISSEQYERMLSEQHLERIALSKKMALSISTSVKDNCALFLEACLKDHMHLGSRFSCFSGNPASKYDHPWFFENIITNPDLDYQERWMPVSVPETCTYYPYDTALILTIERVNL
ncbi:MAG TPA: class I SAM-dependent methyltransferase [Rhabdochlamydiaceae bacterium]|jgi:hypothetical protein